MSLTKKLQSKGFSFFGVECPFCHDRIFSRSNHEFMTCRCKKTSVDGGMHELSQRVIFAPDGPAPASIEPTDEEMLRLASDFGWRTHESKVCLLSECDDAHLVNIAYHTFLRRKVSFAFFASLTILDSRGYDVEKIGDVQIPFKRNSQWWNISRETGDRLPAYESDIPSILEGLRKK